MDALTLCLVVFQISVFILQLDQINCQPLYENPQEDLLTDSGHLYCRKYYGKELFDCYYVLILFIFATNFVVTAFMQDNTFADVLFLSNTIFCCKYDFYSLDFTSMVTPETCIDCLLSKIVLICTI